MDDKIDWLGILAAFGDDEFPEGEGWYIVDENDIIQAGPYRYVDDAWDEVNADGFTRKEK